jgi:hypothetical protein
MKADFIEGFIQKGEVMKLSKSAYLVAGVALGAALGVSLGVVTHEMGAWLPIGTGVGIMVASTAWNRSLNASAKPRQQRGFGLLKD